MGSAIGMCRPGPMKLVVVCFALSLFLASVAQASAVKGVLDDEGDHDGECLIQRQVSKSFVRGGERELITYPGSGYYPWMVSEDVEIIGTDGEPVGEAVSSQTIWATPETAFGDIMVHKVKYGPKPGERGWPNEAQSVGYIQHHTDCRLKPKFDYKKSTKDVIKQLKTLEREHNDAIQMLATRVKHPISSLDVEWEASEDPASSEKHLISSSLNVEKAMDDSFVEHTMTSSRNAEAGDLPSHEVEIASDPGNFGPTRAQRKAEHFDAVRASDATERGVYDDIEGLPTERFVHSAPPRRLETIEEEPSDAASDGSTHSGAP